MKNILIILSDVVLLSTCKRWSLKFKKQNSCFFAKNSQKSLEILNSNLIKLCVIELNFYGIDDLELLKEIHTHHPLLELVILTSNITKEIERKLSTLDSFYFIKKPIKFQCFINLILHLKSANFHANILNDMRISDFLQLIEINKKTCTLSIEMTNNQKQGFIYFEQGILQNAICENFREELAVINILEWKSFKIIFNEFDIKNSFRIIQSSLHDLIHEKQNFAINSNKNLNLLLENNIERHENNIEIDSKVRIDKKDTAEADVKSKVRVEKKYNYIGKLDLDNELKPLQKVDNYWASVIFDMKGEVLVNDNNSQHNFELIDINAVAMKKILIVINDTILLSVFKSWIFRSQKKDTLFLAKNGQEAINIIQSNTIDLLVTELDLPEMDGLELLTVFSSYYPALKVIILRYSSDNEMEKKIRELTSFHFINRPENLKEFINLISALDAMDFQFNSLSEMALADFFGLIELHKKTCLLIIESDNIAKKGIVYFEQGILHDAVSGGFKAEFAIIEMLAWKHIKITFKPLEKKKFRKQIQTSLSTLVNEGNKAKAEIEADVLAIKTKKQDEISVDLLVDVSTEAEENIKEKLQLEVNIKADADAKELNIIKVKIEHINKLPLAKILIPLQELDNYLAAIIFDMTGNILIKNNISEYDVKAISENAIIIIKSAIETINNIGLGTSNFIQLSCNDCIFEAAWVQEDRFVSAILLKSSAKNTGLAKISLIKVCDEIHRQLNLG